MLGIFPRQKQALDFIAAYAREHGRSPELTEIGAALGIVSKGSVCDLVGRLERLGCLSRRRCCPRGIELTAEIAGQRYRFIPKPRAA